ncbi:hypothetical protein DL546_007263 [Coniochaeta pulveracea]|uniref:Uncharacterized protein n=1 Tax=Coniochaeta pulveracea TaxID=177199 RepID=A0A420YIW0_9PEZI|nr:hypothetical protein DL546_007263 [Coniochaeta pulveracea]
MSCAGSKGTTNLPTVAARLTGALLSFDNPIYPDGLAEETLQTLKLLLPQSDKKSRLWLGHQIASSRPLQLDHCLARLGPSRSHERRIENFFYWHDRLVILKQAFDDSSPKTLQQWWHDRRNPVQWYTFWVAIIVFVMTLFFGIIQSVEGAMQVYLSWNHT